eukprot:1156619-Pelagomonas_calceolata.AAC.13
MGSLQWMPNTGEEMFTSTVLWTDRTLLGQLPELFCSLPATKTCGLWELASSTASKEPLFLFAAPRPSACSEICSRMEEELGDKSGAHGSEEMRTISTAFDTECLITLPRGAR